MLATIAATLKLSEPDPTAAARHYRRLLLERHVENCPSCALIGDCGWMQRNRLEES